MDVRLIDMLFVLQRRMGSYAPLEIVSGYRSPATNAMLASSSSAVARNSLHMYGMAVDIRMPGYSTADLASTALNLEVGGVGYYPGGDFVHVDVGPVRSWGRDPDYAPTRYVSSDSDDRGRHSSRSVGRARRGSYRSSRREGRRETVKISTKEYRSSRLARVPYEKPTRGGSTVKVSMSPRGRSVLSGSGSSKAARTRR